MSLTSSAHSVLMRMVALFATTTSADDLISSAVTFDLAGEDSDTIGPNRATEFIILEEVEDNAEEIRFQVTEHGGGAHDRLRFRSHRTSGMVRQQ